MRLTIKTYKLSALELAPKLLGMYLCRNLIINGSEQIIKLKITETEAYYGEDDTACHAHKGKTSRTKVMYEQGGIAYIYLCYGMHHLFNIVCGAKGSPQAVLIRGVENYNGPGKLTKALNITKSLNEENLAVSRQLWVEDSTEQPPYTAEKRIGINYATDEYKNKLWRFVIKSS